MTTQPTEGLRGLIAAALRAHSCGARTLVRTNEPYFVEAADAVVVAICSSQQRDQAAAFALEAADELERKGNVAQSLADAVPAIVASERQEQHREVYEAEARRWHRLADAVRNVTLHTRASQEQPQP